MRTWNELLKKGTVTLETAGIENAEFDVRALILHISGFTRTEYLLYRNSTTKPEMEDVFYKVVEKRAGGYPLQYIIGEWDFYSRSYYVGNGVLIPRPETEELVTYALRGARRFKNPVVFDLCAGTGCVGISVYLENKNAKVYAIEKSDKALEYLEKNKVRHNAEIEIVHGDVFQGFESFNLPAPDIIISNPPYIETNVLKTLQKEVQYEPTMALDGGEDGLAFYRIIAEKWLPFLNEEGTFALECGSEQANSIKEICEKQESDLQVEISFDLGKNSRYVTGTKLSKN